MTDTGAISTEPVSGVARAASRRMKLSDAAMFFSAIIVPGMAGALPGIGGFLVLPFVDEFHVTRGEVLFYIGLGSIAAGVMQPVNGRLLTTRAPWALMLFGAMAAGAALLGVSASPSFVLAALCYVAMCGCAVGFSGNLAGQTIIVRTFPERLGIVSGAQTLATAVSGIAISLIVAPVLVAHGWRFALGATGVATIVLLPLLIILFLRSKAPAPEKADSISDAGPASDEVAPTTLQILSAPAFWLALLSLEPAALVAGAIAGNLLPFYHDRGVDLQHASYALATMAGASAIGSLSIGLLVDRVRPGLTMAGIAAVALTCLCGLALNIADPVVWIGLMFFAVSGLAPTLSAVMRQYFGAAGYAPAFGMMGPFMILSAFSGAIAGWMRDQFGNYQIVFAALGAGMVVALIGSLLLLKAKPRIYRAS